MIRVLIATASEATRSWFAAFPSRLDGVSIIGIVQRAGLLSEQVHELAPDVVVIDVADGEPEAIAGGLASVRDSGVDVVLMLNDDSWHGTPLALIRSGVRGLIPSQPTVEELQATIRAVAAGFVVLEPRLLQDGLAATSATAEAQRTSQASPLATQPLTRREIEVLSALAEGYANKQIAARLDMSEHTVKTHLAAIFEKLEVSNRTEAVLAGARLGLVLL